MATESRSGKHLSERKSRSLFDLPSNFFDSSSPLSGVGQSFSSSIEEFADPPKTSLPNEPVCSESEEEDSNGKSVYPRWSCNTCKVEFESLQDQRSHFKSDFHRFNVKLTIAGKISITEEQFEELTSKSFLEDCDISSISGSEDEAEEDSCPRTGRGGNVDVAKRKLLIRLNSGEIVSVWKCLLSDENEDFSSGDNKVILQEKCGLTSREEQLVERLKFLIHEPRDTTCLRIVLLASGGHFAGCVFDGNNVLAHKTFHRYVVRAKAGKKQSSQDATGKTAKSAGSSLRRYNELALKKEVRELFAAWKPYFDISSGIFIYAPSNNRQLFYDGEKAHFSHQKGAVRHVPLTVRRPTLKVAKHIYNLLTLMVYEVQEKGCPPSVKGSPLLSAITVEESHADLNKEVLRGGPAESETSPDACLSRSSSGGISISSKSEIVLTTPNGIDSTPLHEASKAGDARQTLQLLEQGSDPCIRDARGRTPYTLAADKEVRDTFRRFMALNLDRWDWHAANVPSALTKEMEESQAAKQAEKDAKRKAKAKELKKLRKAKEKAQAQAKAQALAQKPPATSTGPGASNRILKQPPQSNTASNLSKEEELRRQQAEEREKRAAAAERRIAALNSSAASTKTAATSSSQPRNSDAENLSCSCCMTSLAGKVPFHRYHYKYCSTSCMHVHREMLEDG